MRRKKVALFGGRRANRLATTIVENQRQVDDRKFLRVRRSDLPAHLPRLARPWIRCSRIAFSPCAVWLSCPAMDVSNQDDGQFVRGLWLCQYAVSGAASISLIVANHISLARKAMETISDLTGFCPSLN